MKKSSWSERHVLGAAHPQMSDAVPVVNADGVAFTMGCSGIDYAFVVDKAALANLDGQPDGEVDALATFAKHRAKISGVASRLMRAGVTASPVILHPAYFR